MKLPPLLVALAFLGGCAAAPPPALVPLSGPPTGLEQACASVYPRGRWQFVHLIEFQRGNDRGTVIGVTVLDRERIDCILTTTEGMTLFQAREGQQLEILRAVPPFDRPGFGTGLMRDVHTLFRRPGAASVRYGSLGGEEVCRLLAPDGRVTDILPAGDHCFRIHTWSPDRSATQTVVADQCRIRQGYRLPGTLVLSAAGAEPYTLRMTLVDVQPPPGDDVP